MSTEVTKMKKSIERKKVAFIDVAIKSKYIFDKEGIPLTFEGYKDVICQYLQCNENDFETLFTLIRDVNLWIKYMGEIESLTLNLQLKYSNMISYLKAFNLTPEVQIKLENIILDFNNIKTMYKHLKIQRKMFERIHYHCSNMYKEALEQLLYREIY